MDRRLPALVIAAQCTLFVAAAVVPAHAQEHPILGKRAQVKNQKPSDPTKRKIIVQAKELASSDTIDGDPTSTGGTLDVLIYNGSTLTIETYSLSAIRWTATGTAGFKYKDGKLVDGPVSSIVIAKHPVTGTFKINVKVAAKNPLHPVAVVPQDPSIYTGAVLTITGGGKYCINFGGAAGGLIKKNDATRFVIQNPMNQSQCPNTSATCGNNVTEPPFETCDGTDMGGLCPSALCGSNGLPCLCPFCGDNVNDVKRCVGGSAPGTGCTDDNDCPDGGTCFDEQCDGCDSTCSEGCSFTCECTTCGDGNRQGPVEECEPGEALGPSNFCPGACLPVGDPNQCLCAICGDNSVNLPRCVGGENDGFGCSDPSDCTNGTCFTEMCDGTDASACTTGSCLPVYDDNQCTCTMCGNGILEPPIEICDLGDAAACTGGGACQANCTCCGDGIINANEVCEPGDNTPCDGGGTCQSNCTCCGDGIANAGEDCDGLDATGCLTGLCNPDCTCVPVPPSCPP